MIYTKKSRTTEWRRKRGVKPRKLNTGQPVEVKEQACHRIGRRYFGWLYVRHTDDINQTIHQLVLENENIHDWCELARVTSRYLYRLARELGYRKSKNGWII
jgi:hypothetical protein